MNGQPKVRLAWPVVLALIATAAWLLGALGRSDPLLGLPQSQSVLGGIAWIGGAVAAVLLLGHAIFGIASRHATGFHQAVVYLLLTFVASFLVMLHFGFDVGAVLTTSAIVTAVVGLALQPTLGTMIAGFTVVIDGIVRTGDCILHDGEWVRIESLRWRSAVARRVNNAQVIVPNSQIADRSADVIRGGTPLAVTTSFYVPANVAPQRIASLVTAAVLDFATVDTSQPVIVGPTRFEPRQAAIRYRVQYSLIDPLAMDAMEIEVLRRIWHVFQREQILVPVSRLYGDGSGFATATTDALVLSGWIQRALAAGGADALNCPPEVAAQALRREGRLLLYGPDERIVLPDGTDDWRFLLIHGEAAGSHEYGLDETDPSRAMQAWSMGREAQVRIWAERLAQHIGPYAEIAVRRAARITWDPAALCREVAKEIEDADERARFLAEAMPQEIERHGPGLVFRARRAAAGTLICHLALRTVGEAAIVGIRPGLLEVGQRAAE